jgi:hypothetical protein
MGVIVVSSLFFFLDLAIEEEMVIFISTTLPIKNPNDNRQMTNFDPGTK